MIEIKLQNGTLRYVPEFYDTQLAFVIFTELMQGLKLQQNDIKIFGKTYNTPRLEAFYAKNGEQYGYSGKKMKTQEFTPLLHSICEKIETLTGEEFNSVLVNLYRDGQDSNGWHSDDEKELGVAPFIASLSLGETRDIQFKHKGSHERKVYPLRNGSLILMSGEIQKYWKHQIPKTKLKKEARLNLTFRKIIG
jgi:alkylated DNA repair dioxygenase AlkB